MDQFLSFLSNPAVLSVGAMGLEALFRLLPTQKPLSIAHIAASVLHMAGNVAGGVANFLDKVLPQNIASGPSTPAS